MEIDSTILEIQNLKKSINFENSKIENVKSLLVLSDILENLMSFSLKKRNKQDAEAKFPGKNEKVVKLLDLKVHYQTEKPINV